MLQLSCAYEQTLKLELAVLPSWRDSSHQRASVMVPHSSQISLLAKYTMIDRQQIRAETSDKAGDFANDPKNIELTAH